MLQIVPTSSATISLPIDMDLISSNRNRTNIYEPVEMVVGGLLQVSIILMIIITMQKNRAGHAKEAIAKGLLIDGRLRATVDLLIPLPFDDGQHKLGMLKF